MNIILKPIVSEKMTRLTEKAANPVLTRIQRRKGKTEVVARNRYGFIVDKRANKMQIKSAVESLYNVHVQDVNTMNYSGKNKSRFTKAGFLTGHTNAFKKAIITLAPGNTIDLYASI